jgi:hypothetical protein
MRIFLAFFFILISSSFVIANQEVDSLIAVLENTIKQRAEFDKQKTNRILELKRLLKKKEISKSQEFFINNQLIEEYSKFTLDSAVYFLQLNIQLAQKLQKPELLNQTQIAMADLMATTGKYFDAIDILGQIDSERIIENLKVPYYQAMIKVYDEICFHSPVTDFNQKYSTKAQAYTDSIFPYLEPGTEAYLSLQEKKHRDERNLVEGMNINSQRLSKTEIGNKLFSMIAYERSLLYKLEDNEVASMKYLCLSAISDIISSNKDNASLTELALLLHKRGDIDRANRFIKFSYEDALFYRSELRFKLISEILPIINDAYQLKTEKSQERLSSLLVITGILMLT